ncbi:hypothetical protein EV360DRAFT_26142, partial [Lentinula raphanica]
ESPPHTPQRHRDAERQRERGSRTMDSPQLRRTPQSSQNNPGGPIPFQIEIPQGYVPPVHSQNDPFQIVQHNGHALHLTPGIAAQLQQL